MQPFKIRGRINGSIYSKVSDVWKHCKIHFCSKEASVRFPCPSNDEQASEYIDGEPDPNRSFDVIKMSGCQERRTRIGWMDEYGDERYFVNTIKWIKGTKFRLEFTGKASLSGKPYR